MGEAASTLRRRAPLVQRPVEGGRVARLPAPAPATASEHQAVFDLQRAAGNAATTALIQSLRRQPPNEGKPSGPLPAPPRVAHRPPPRALQRSAGNAATGELLQSVQRNKEGEALHQPTRDASLTWETTMFGIKTKGSLVASSKKSKAYKAKVGGTKGGEDEAPYLPDVDSAAYLGKLKHTLKASKKGVAAEMSGALGGWEAAQVSHPALPGVTLTADITGLEAKLAGKNMTLDLLKMDVKFAVDELPLFMWAGTNIGKAIGLDELGPPPPDLVIKFEGSAEVPLADVETLKMLTAQLAERDKQMKRLAKILVAEEKQASKVAQLAAELKKLDIEPDDLVGKIDAASKRWELFQKLERQKARLTRARSLLARTGTLLQGAKTGVLAVQQWIVELGPISRARVLWAKLATTSFMKVAGAIGGRLLIWANLAMIAQDLELLARKIATFFRPGEGKLEWFGDPSWGGRSGQGGEGTPVPAGDYRVGKSDGVKGEVFDGVTAPVTGEGPRGGTATTAPVGEGPEGTTTTEPLSSKEPDYLESTMEPEPRETPAPEAPMSTPQGAHEEVPGEGGPTPGEGPSGPEPVKKQTKGKAEKKGKKQGKKGKKLAAEPPDTLAPFEPRDLLLWYPVEGVFKLRQDRVAYMTGKHWWLQDGLEITTHEPEIVDTEKMENGQLLVTVSYLSTVVALPSGAGPDYPWVAGQVEPQEATYWFDPKDLAGGSMASPAQLEKAIKERLFKTPDEGEGWGVAGTATVPKLGSMKLVGVSDVNEQTGYTLVDVILKPLALDEPQITLVTSYGIVVLEVGKEVVVPVLAEVTEPSSVNAEPASVGA